MYLIAAPEMTVAGKIITYVLFPALAVAIPAGIVALWRANKAAKARAVAAAIVASENTSRMDTQDQALARLLEVINPIGAPNLTAVLTRIQADQEADRTRLSDHIAQAAEDKRAFERRLELWRGSA